MTFWFELASTYSYLSAMRVEGDAAKRGVRVVWKPFLLGPIFHAQGWNSSPFKIYPAKGVYMWRDMERLCAAQGLPFQTPNDLDGFPRHSVLAARISCAGLAADWGKDFVQAAYKAEFGQGLDIGDKAVLAGILSALGQDPEAVFAHAGTSNIKQELRANSDAAMAHGLFGAPSFTVGEELFWGNDRLEDALSWAVQHG